MADGKFSNRSNRDADGFSLQLTDKPSEDIIVGSLTTGYYPLTAKNITGTMSASTIGRFSSATATDSTAIVGRMIAAASSGGGLSASANYTGTPTVTITPTNTVGGTEVTEANKGTYYVKIVANSAKLTGTTTVKRAAFSATTAGYQPKGTLLAEGSQTASVTVNSGTSTKYINIPAGSCTVAGGGLSGSDVTPEIKLRLNAQNTSGAAITTNKPSSGYYLTIGGSSTKTTASVTRAAITDEHTAGYIPAKTATTVISSETKTLNINSGTATSYITIPAGSCTVAGGGLSGSDVTPEIKLGLNAQTTSGVGITDNQPSSGYYLTIGGSSTKTTASVTRAAITDTHTAGYIPAKTKTTEIPAETKTLNINAGSKTRYITIPPLASSGGGLSTTANYTGTPTVTITPTTDSAGRAVISETNEGIYYITVVANSEKLTGTTTVKRAAFNATTAGYQPKGTLLDESSQTASVTVKSGTSTKYINIPAGNCTVAGGELSGSDVTPEIKLGLKAQTTSGVAITDTDPGSGYYLTIGGSSTKTTASVTRAAITDAHTAGYIPAKEAATAISAATKTLNINAGSKTRYITIPTLASSGGGLSTTANYTGTPTVTITPTNTVGGTEVEESDKGSYYIKIVANSAKLTGTTTVKRAALNITTAGYQPKGTLLDESSQNANVTVNSGSSTKYIKIPSAVYANGFVNSAGYIPEGTNVYTTTQTDECITINFN